MKISEVIRSEGLHEHVEKKNWTSAIRVLGWCQPTGPFFF